LLSLFHAHKFYQKADNLCASIQKDLLYLNSKGIIFFFLVGLKTEPAFNPILPMFREKKTRLRLRAFTG
jgi:hypothetical protein